ncbi:MAG TPA: ParB/RepB/Spo0J family partition protein [Aquabacterium sp.]|nr:ParB/RepB/Spo0J family partition protein [Aquabacterium sp.]
MTKGRSMAAKGAIDFSDLDQGQSSAQAVALASTAQEVADAAEAVAKPPSPPSPPAPAAQRRSGVAAIGRSISIQQELHDVRDRLRQYEDAKIVVRLDPQKIRDSRWRNRDLRSFETPEFRTLKEEIQRSGGNVQPVKVRRLLDSDEYEIVYGRRRTRACLELGLPVSAVIEDLSEQQAYMEMYRENVAREALTPWEQGVMYDDALTQGLFPSLRRLAEALGISSGNVTVARKLAHLPKEIVDAFPSPLDLQFRWALPLEESLQKDPQRVLRLADEFAKTNPRPPAKVVFEQLTGVANGAQRSGLAAYDLKVGRKVVGSINFDSSGGVTMKVKPGAVPAAKQQRLIEAVSKFLAED